MDRDSQIVRRPAVEIETYVDGSGPALVILPSYGRDGGEDYDDITARVAQGGWWVLRPRPRGLAGSSGPMTGVTLHDLADDIAAVIRDLGGRRAVLLGHAVSRMVATDHTDLVVAVILAASQASKGPQTWQERRSSRVTWPGQRQSGWRCCAGLSSRLVTMPDPGWSVSIRRR